MDIQSLQFPIGKWSPKGEYTPEEIQERIDTLKSIPAAYRALTETLSHEDLQKQYREGSWTIRQLIHHVADMHLLHYIRFKQSLTETAPNGVVAKIDAWATMEEAKTAPIAYSLQMIEGTHARWTYLIEQMSEEDFRKGIITLLAKFISNYLMRWIWVPGTPNIIWPISSWLWGLSLVTFFSKSSLTHSRIRAP